MFSLDPRQYFVGAMALVLSCGLAAFADDKSNATSNGARTAPSPAAVAPKIRAKAAAALTERQAAATKPGARSDVKLLFVIDCSASMRIDQRMELVKTALKRFADETANGSLDVGVRLLGHSVDNWTGSGTPEDEKAEEAAKHDTKRVLPVGPFDQESFKRTVDSLKPVGSTPLFYALLEARRDFADAKTGSRRVILISDGGDNWALVGQRPGIVELKNEYERSGIPIHCLAFPVEPAELKQLEQIAKVSGGKVVPVRDESSIRKSLASLTAKNP